MNANNLFPAFQSFITNIFQQRLRYKELPYDILRTLDSNREVVHHAPKPVRIRHIGWMTNFSLRG